MSEFIKVKNRTIETMNKLLKSKRLTVIAIDDNDIIIRIHDNNSIQDFIQL